MLRKLLTKIFYKFIETKWGFRLNKSNVRICRGGIAQIGQNVIIKNTVIFVDKSSKLVLKDNVRLDGVKLFLTNGAYVEINEYSFIEINRNPVKPEYIIDNGKLIIADHTKLACARVWIRFGGCCFIGSYSNINNGSEIRSDENVSIGSFCQISYNNRIWDTNTHSIYQPNIRRQMTIDTFPSFGKEHEKPLTKPVYIGNGCWLGERVSILKGCNIGDNVIIGFNTTLSNKTISSNCCVVQNVQLLIKQK